MHDSASAKLNINALLNPSESSQRIAETSSNSQAFIRNGTPTPLSPESQATPPPSARSKRQKLIKDGAVFERGPLKGPNNYPPHESMEPSIILTSKQAEELALQHRRFQIFPSGNQSADDGLISDFPRRIPYSSDKKSFLNKTGRDLFRKLFLSLEYGIRRGKKSFLNKTGRDLFDGMYQHQFHLAHQQR